MDIVEKNSPLLRQPLKDRDEHDLAPVARQPLAEPHAVGQTRIVTLFLVATRRFAE